MNPSAIHLPEQGAQRPGPSPKGAKWLGAILGWLLLLSGFGEAMGQQSRPSGLEAARNLRFPSLEFRAPRVETRTLSSGVRVFLLRDRTLPLVTLTARIEGGYANFPRALYAAGTALPSLLRSGGTSALPPDSVDRLLDHYALQTSFGGGGESTSSSLNTLTRHLEPALDLWRAMLRDPAFDSTEVEVWRDRQMESVRRRKDDPGRLAFSEFNRLMFGDHPIGWEMTEGDLDPDLFTREALQEIHGRTYCAEHLLLGVVGDVEWSRIGPLLEEWSEGWPSCPEPLGDPPEPEMRRGGGVFLIPRNLTQSTVVMAQPGGIRQGTDRDFFDSRIGNSILGASGFSSRILSRVRTEEGYAYSASSLWTTPSRYEGIVGAVTQTKSESTIAAVRLILEIMEEMRQTPPPREEVDMAISRIVNGFVFNFQDPYQIVSRQMFYQSQGLPQDWLDRYLEGIQRVRPSGVRRVFREHVRPREMTILIVGNPAAFDLPPETLGEVTIWEVEGLEERPPVSGLPRGGPRSPR